MQGQREVGAGQLNPDQIDFDEIKLDEIQNNESSFRGRGCGSIRGGRRGRGRVFRGRGRSRTASTAPIRDTVSTTPIRNTAVSPMGRKKTRRGRTRRGGALHRNVQKLKKLSSPVSSATFKQSLERVRTRAWEQHELRGSRGRGTRGKRGRGVGRRRGSTTSGETKVVVAVPPSVEVDENAGSSSDERKEESTQGKNPASSLSDALPKLPDRVSNTFCHRLWKHHLVFAIFTTDEEDQHSSMESLLLFSQFWACCMGLSGFFFGYFGEVPWYITAFCTVCIAVFITKMLKFYLSKSDSTKKLLLRERLASLAASPPEYSTDTARAVLAACFGLSIIMSLLSAVHAASYKSLVSRGKKDYTNDWILAGMMAIFIDFLLLEPAWIFFEYISSKSTRSVETVLANVGEELNGTNSSLPLSHSKVVKKNDVSNDNKTPDSDSDTTSDSDGGEDREVIVGSPPPQILSPARKKRKEDSEVEDEVVGIHSLIPARPRPRRPQSLQPIKRPHAVKISSKLAKHLEDPKAAKRI
eukprot:jgi/Bigna1/137085/aug1.37_g11793